MNRQLKIATITVPAVIVAAVVIQEIKRASTEVATTKCIENLNRIDSVKVQWARDVIARTNISLKYDRESVFAAIESSPIKDATPTWHALSNYFCGGLDVPQCPSGGTYTLGRIQDLPTCSVPGHVLK